MKPELFLMKVEAAGGQYVLGAQDRTRSSGCTGGIEDTFIMLECGVHS